MMEVTLIGKHKVKGIYVDKKLFRILKGSEFVMEVRNSCPMRIREIRDDLIRTRKVVDGYFMEDVEFTSPSYAASVCMGRTGNGMRCWITNNGERLGAVLATNDL